MKIKGLDHAAIAAKVNGIVLARNTLGGRDLMKKYWLMTWIVFFVAVSAVIQTAAAGAAGKPADDPEFKQNPKGVSEMEIEGLDHVAIGVRDMDKAVEWFARVLGTEFYDIAGSAEVSVEDLGARYMLSLDHGVELISPVLPVKETAAPHIKRLAKLLEDRDTVVMRIAFKVEGLDEAAFEEKGVRIESKIEAEEVKPLPLRNIREFLGREEDTLGIQMMFIEFDRP
ncbi:MAG: VOC family protein [Pseudomonadales bacterium]|jgi:catechol 2,3-dioxygenase-like lactoylglutathione lyase family enzyme|nr:VOC family protein [Pseudomonadales bacterium]MDP6470009.1 VOC family protein [Pseudomonadales bacterium]MDP6826909.1 VOC family protein [Pseudomonadales bacterium]|tara:strand:+ start:6934 stop:7614 length:681 start_codon:yes stop_codon:yes gene_type:complete